MNNLLSFNYWLNIRPDVLTPLAQNILVFFMLILATLSIISFIVITKKKTGLYTKIWKRISSFSVTNLIIGALLWFFTYETIPLLSARFWFLLWAASMITWLVFIVINLTEIPIKKEQLQKEKEFKKYIP